LLEVVAATHSPRCLARRLDSRQKKSNEYADDRDDHQQLDEREGSMFSVIH
jgi:hypothetical protein